MDVRQHFNRGIRAEPDIYHCQPGDSIDIRVAFRNMEACTLRYSVTGSTGGHITQQGVYTAPDCEGVNELQIVCTDFPYINTHAYVIVQSDHEE